MIPKALRRAGLLFALPFALAGCFYQQLSEAELSDPGIKARLEAQLQAEPGLDLRYVTVDVHARVATVSGLVRSWNEKRTVERIARRLQGVEQAVINLVIQE